MQRRVRISRLMHRRAGPILALALAGVNIVALEALPSDLATGYCLVVLVVAVAAVVMISVSARSVRTTYRCDVVLTGGPCDGQLIYSGSPEQILDEIWLVGPDGATSIYRSAPEHLGTRRVLRYQTPLERRSSTRG